MKRKLFTAAMLTMGMTAMAQETYESATLTDQDLNGTARYVGMGGAMDALGADISTISSNPAGIGLFRKSQVLASAGVMVSASNADADFFGNKKTTLGLDQAGIVIAMPSSIGYMNFALNYHKSKNFNQLYSAVGALNNASQNKNAWMDGGRKGYSQVDHLYGNVLGDNYVHADGYDMLRSTRGYTSNFDFCFAANFNERFYLGLTVGVKDLNYESSSSYLENIPNSGYMELTDYRRVDGTGVDFTLGAIFRPFEYSPFRIGLSIATPSFYTIKTSNETYLFNKTGLGTSYDDDRAEAKAYYDYEFSLNTPWKFGVSLGTTIGSQFAIGAGYEYADYSTIDNRVQDKHDTYFGYQNTFSDKAMNAHTKKVLKGVSTFKVGAELKPVPAVAIRAGYNYVTPKFSKDFGKEYWIDSWGTECASQTDYVNWQQANRITLGVGFQLSPEWTLDLAYQYSAMDGEYHPFYDTTTDIADEFVYLHKPIYGDAEKGYYITNYADAVNISDKRHQVLLTLGYRF